jgi:transcriptional regulator with AAA-type ATPase domain
MAQNIYQIPTIQLLLHTKKHPYQSPPVLVEWDLAKSTNMPEEITQQGSICLIAGLNFEILRKHFEIKMFLDCGEKADKIDLKRALRFDEKKDRDKPKQVVFNSSSIGALKRSLNAFFEKHYTAIDPPCLIVIPDSIFEAFTKNEVKLSKRRREKPAIDEQDPLFLLINVPESNPLTKKLEGIYLGTSIEVKHTRALIYLACQSDSPVLILGESGTGKDVIASQIYENASSYKKGFFRVNCSALPESLLEGELFGYVKGSFTGASADKVGLFTAAENGTIFLDEIGDLSLANQVKILHAVENHGIRQIGSNKTRPVNVRIIAATNRNLDAMMRQGTFREDLYYRISAFRINSHPLREHPEDIPLLAISYWEKKKRSSKLSKTFLEYLKTYQWPGNVRELYSLLNSLVDYFGDIQPTPAHVDAIRKSRQDVLVQSTAEEKDDPAQFLKIKSQNVLVAIQNILRSVKVEMNPAIYERLQTGGNGSEYLRKFLSQEITRIDELCLEPAYFKRWEIFKMMTRYKQLLDNTLKNWPGSSDKPGNIWTEELQKLDDKINQAIMELLWGKVDM